MMPTIPTRQDAFQMYMKSKTATEQYVDELGFTVEPLEYGWGYDDFEWDVKPLKQEEAEEFVKLVNCTVQTQYAETDIVQMIEEETQAYFEGTRSLDKTIDIIQDRCTKYVNENR